MEGLVIEVAAVCKGNSEKVCTGDFGQEIERIKLLQRKFYFLKEASMFWDYTTSFKEVFLFLQGAV